MLLLLLLLLTVLMLQLCFLLLLLLLSACSCKQHTGGREPEDSMKTAIHEEATGQYEFVPSCKQRVSAGVCHRACQMSFRPVGTRTPGDDPLQLPFWLHLKGCRHLGSCKTTMTANISSVVVSVSSTRDPANDQDETQALQCSLFFLYTAPFFLCTQRMACSTMPVMQYVLCISSLLNLIFPKVFFPRTLATCTVLTEPQRLACRWNALSRQHVIVLLVSRSL